MILREPTDLLIPLGVPLLILSMWGFQSHPFRTQHRGIGNGDSRTPVERGTSATHWVHDIRPLIGRERRHRLLIRQGRAAVGSLRRGLLRSRHSLLFG